MALARLDSLGGIAGASMFGDVASRGELQRLGLATWRGMPPATPHAPRLGRTGENVWWITPLGREYLEGRIMQVEIRPGGRRWVATWLRSLPRDVTL